MRVADLILAETADKVLARYFPIVVEFVLLGTYNTPFTCRNPGPSSFQPLNNSLDFQPSSSED